MIELDTVLMKVVSRCNINCTYCYVFNMGDSGWRVMPKQMSSQTVAAVALALGELSRAQQQVFAVVLHGGEPLLLDYPSLSRILSTLRGVLGPEYPLGIQTNGLLISEKILDLCEKHRTSLSVSIDGPQHVHDRDRVGHRGEGTHARVLEGIHLLRQHSASQFLFAGLLAVIDAESDPSEVYGFMKQLGAPSVDFLYRDGNHTRLPSGKASADSTEYGQWLCRLLEVYFADQNPIRIRVLDDLIKLVLGGFGSKEDVVSTDHGILVIDTDGSFAKNDTMKSSFDRADRFQQPWSVHSNPLMDLLGSPEFASYHALQSPTSPQCRSCSELGVCGGGMTLHRWRDDNSYDNPSVYCADQKLLIGHIRGQLAAIRECA